VELKYDQAAIVSAYTGFMCGSFSDMYKYIEDIMERPVFTHELGSADLVVEIKERSKEDFVRISKNLT